MHLTHPPKASRYFLTFEASVIAEQNAIKDGEIWLLLTRHLVDKKRSKEFIALNTSELEKGRTGYQEVKAIAGDDLKVSTAVVCLEES